MAWDRWASYPLKSRGRHSLPGLASAPGGALSSGGTPGQFFLPYTGDPSQSKRPKGVYASRQTVHG